MPIKTDLPLIYDNLTDYSVQLDVQSLDPSNLDGGTGSISLSGAAVGQPQRLKNKQFTITDITSQFDDIVRTNLAQNPSAEGTSGPTEVMRNHCTAPQANNAWTVSYGTGGAGTTTTVADARFQSGFARRMQWTTAGSGSGYIAAALGPTVAIGETYTYSIRADIGALGNVPLIQIGIAYTSVANGIVDHGDGTKTYWRTVTFTAAGVASLVFGYFGTAPIGLVILAGDALITKTPVRQAFFMPAITANSAGVAQIAPAVNSDTDLTTAWVGTQNAGASLLNGAAVALGSAGVSKVIQSSKWYSTGTKSARIISNFATPNTAYFEIASHGTPRGLTVGSTYTLKIKIHMEAAQSVDYSAGRQVRLIYKIGAAPYVDLISPKAANTANTTTDISWTFTIPAGATEWYLRIYNGSPWGDADVYWDDLSIVAGEYWGPFWYGGTPDSPTADYAWTGTVDASTSTRTPLQVVSAQAIGRVSSVDVRQGVVQISAETMLNRLTATVTVSPYWAVLNTGMNSVLASVGMTCTGLPAVAGNRVSFPGWRGSLLDYLKHFCAVYNYEFLPSTTDPDQIIFRTVRGATFDSQYVTHDLNVNSQSVAKSVSIVNYNYSDHPSVMFPPLPLTPNRVDNMQVLTVDSGEIATYEIQLNAWVLVLNQPTAYDLVGPDFYGSSAEGAYCVSGADGLPITAAQWTALGGSVKAEITEDPSIIRVTVTAPDAHAIMGPDGDAHLAPYSIAATSGDNNYYNSLHLTAKFTEFNKETIVIPTGVSEEVTVDESSITVDNPWVKDRNSAFSLGVRAAASYSGAAYEVQASTNSQLPIGTLVGSRVVGDDTMLRITSVTSTPTGQSFQATLDTLISDFNSTHSGKTFTALNAILGSMTFDEWATVPLKKVADA